MESRIHYLDIAKGAFILLLICHHITDASALYGIGLNCFKFYTKWQSVYSAFFMQAFFFISGYCSNFNKPFSVFYFLNITSLGIPIVTLSILQLVFYSLTIENYYFWEKLLSFDFWVKDTHLWFLYALLIAKIIVWFLNYYIKSSWQLIIGLVLLFFGLVANSNIPKYNYFCLFHALTAVFFISLGNTMCKKNNVYEQLLVYLPFFYPIILILIKVFGYNIPSLTAGLWVKPSEIFLLLITSLSGVFFSLKICIFISHNVFIEYWGRNTLVFYGIHYMILGYVIKVINTYIFTPKSTIDGIVFILLSTVITIIICYIIIELFNRTFLKYLFGRK